MPFPFEQLKVYQLSLTWVATVNAENFDLNPFIKKSFIDQLGRAALSIPLNIAEGSGRFHDNERRQYFRIARGSVYECVAALQILQSTKAIDSNFYLASYSMLEELSKMVSGLIKSVEE